jgi:hypothetical protein
MDRWVCSLVELIAVYSKLLLVFRFLIGSKRILADHGGRAVKA